MIGDLRPQIQEIKDNTHALIGELAADNQEIRRDVREELADAREAMRDFATLRRPGKPKKLLALVAGDDLTQIQGLGAASEERLHKAGITSFAQLAMSTADEVEEKLGAAAGGLHVDGWIEQTRDLAA